MRNRRFELAAWEVYECGKPWAEADADVAEAIDFCEFYAREMIRLAEPQAPRRPRRDQFHRAPAARRGRGHPPLELPAGDPHRHDRGRAGRRATPSILKPAEQSPVIAWHLARVLHEAGLPPGVLNYLPGLGEESARRWSIIPAST